MSGGFWFKTIKFRSRWMERAVKLIEKMNNNLEIT